MSRRPALKQTFCVLFFFLLISFAAPVVKPQAAESQTQWRIPYRVGARWGLVDKDKRVIAAARYDYMPLAVYGTASLIVVNVGGRPVTRVGDGVYNGIEGGRWGIIDGNGAELIPLRYDAIALFDKTLVSFELDGKHGLMNRAGREIVPLKDKRSDFIVEGNLVWVRMNRGMTGELYHLGGGGRIEVALEAGENFSLDDGVITFTGRNGAISGYGIVDTTGAKVVRLNYSDVEGFRSGLALVKAFDAQGNRNGKCGFIDARGKEVIPLVYDECEPNGFGGDAKALARVARRGKYGLINTRGEELTPFKYDFIAQFSSNRAYVTVNGKAGYVNDEGQEIIAPLYDLYYADSGLMRSADSKVEFVMAKQKEKHGVLSTGGRTVIPFVYDGFLSETYGSFGYFLKLGVLWAKRGDKYALVDVEGREVIPAKYTSVRVNDSQYYEQGFPVQLGTKWGMVSREGKEIVPARYDWIDEYPSAGFIRAGLGGGYGLLDAQGREVVPFQYEDLGSVRDGMLRAKRQGKYGVVTTGGAEVVPFKYDRLEDFVRNAAIASAGGKWGLVDRQGREVLPLKYDRVELASRALEDESAAQLRYLVLVGDKTGYVGEDGREVTLVKYDDYGNRRLKASASDKSWRFSNGVACVKQGSKYGLINLDGKEIIAPKYDRPFYFENEGHDLTLVVLNGKQGYVDKNGVEYFED